MSPLDLCRPIAPFCVLLLLATADSVCGQSWQRLASGISPARFAPQATAAAGGTAVLFGGAQRPTTPYGDTWTFDNGRWRRVVPASSPTPRHSGAMAFDSARGRSVLFGGFDGSFQRLNDTWEWDGATWTRIPTPVAPPPRAFHRMAFDPVRQVVVLFGGGASFTQRLNDTWEWDGRTWTRVTPTTSPPVRSGHGMAYAPALGGIVIHGGALSGAASSIKNDTWLYDGRTWRRLQTGPRPPHVTSTDLATEPVYGSVLFFGGASPSGDPTGTWRLHPSHGWEQFAVPVAPTSRTDHETLQLTTGEVILVAGGVAFGSASGDSWEFGGDSAAATTFGAGCPSTLNGPELAPDPDQLPRVGQSARVRATGFGGGYANAWLNVSGVGAAGISIIDLGPFGLPGCSGYVSRTGPVVSVLAALTSGGAAWTLQVPSTPALIGIELINQAVAVDNSGALATTSGVALTVGS